MIREGSSIMERMTSTDRLLDSEWEPASLVPTALEEFKIVCAVYDDGRLDIHRYEAGKPFEFTLSLTGYTGARVAVLFTLSGNYLVDGSHEAAGVTLIDAFAAESSPGTAWIAEQQERVRELAKDLASRDMPAVYECAMAVQDALESAVCEPKQEEEAAAPAAAPSAEVNAQQEEVPVASAPAGVDWASDDDELFDFVPAALAMPCDCWGEVAQFMDPPEVAALSMSHPLMYSSVQGNGVWQRLYEERYPTCHSERVRGEIAGTKMKTAFAVKTFGMGEQAPPPSFKWNYAASYRYAALKARVELLENEAVASKSHASRAVKGVPKGTMTTADALRLVEAEDTFEAWQQLADQCQAETYCELYHETSNPGVRRVCAFQANRFAHNYNIADTMLRSIDLETILPKKSLAMLNFPTDAAAFQKLRSEISVRSLDSDADQEHDVTSDAVSRIKVKTKDVHPENQPRGVANSSIRVWSAKDRRMKVIERSELAELRQTEVGEPAPLLVNENLSWDRARARDPTLTLKEYRRMKAIRYGRRRMEAMQRQAGEN